MSDDETRQYVKLRVAHVNLQIQQSEVILSLDLHRRNNVRPLCTGITIWVKNAEWVADISH